MNSSKKSSVPKEGQFAAAKLTKIVSTLSGNCKENSCQSKSMNKFLSSKTGDETQQLLLRQFTNSFASVLLSNTSNLAAFSKSKSLTCTNKNKAGSHENQQKIDKQQLKDKQSSPTTKQTDYPTKASLQFYLKRCPMANQSHSRYSRYFLKYIPMAQLITTQGKTLTNHRIIQSRLLAQLQNEVNIHQ